jgi:hypothetical protein
MGQAKIRATEIAKLKALDASLNILAVRYKKDGTSEFCNFAINSKVSMISSKDSLLHTICTSNWGHTPPCQAIACYLKKSQSYDFFKNIGIKCKGYLIMFYESDLDKPQYYSCRQISPINDDEHLNSLVLTIKTEAEIISPMSYKAA